MFSVKRIVQMAMLCAISIILVYYIHFPIIPAAPFLEYDPADIPIFICTFLFGPLSGFILTIVVSILQALTVSAQSGWIGGLMHIFATGSFVIAAGHVYNKFHGKSYGLILSCIVGVITMTVSMVAWNILMTPIFMGVPRKAVLDMIIPVIVPFNLIKAGVNSVIALSIFSTIKRYVKS